MLNTPSEAWANMQVTLHLFGRAPKNVVIYEI